MSFLPGKASGLDAEKAAAIFDYDPHSGSLKWRCLSRDACESDMAWRAKSRVFGKEAGSILKNGYRSVAVDGKRYYAHRIAWLLLTGDWPRFDIDHINGCRSDNSRSNLREATREQNQQNRSGTNTTGASWHTKAGKWRAVIVSKGKQTHLGYYDTEAEAAEAYREAKMQSHKFNPVLRMESP